MLCAVGTLSSDINWECVFSDNFLFWDGMEIWPLLSILIDEDLKNNREASLLFDILQILQSHFLLGSVKFEDMSASFTELWFGLVYTIRNV
ncbi:hypothetical protein VNO77_21411 [Canavalia gladiata]|uniref:Uncharacterized protein n=1 Tax=Canavalia gladiata TaxID=3824 RepID=A0AAN9QNE2_CANGL